MQAAAHPAKVDYLYFVRKADCKSHFFTASLEEFNNYPRGGLELRLTIGGATRLVGLIGDPVDALALAAHAERRVRRGRARLGVRAAAGEAASGSRRPCAGLVALGFAGANVTIPHKTAVVGFCDELDDVAERAGSVNTLVVRDGRVLGSSTDGPGGRGPRRGRREPACSCSARAAEHRRWRRRSATPGAESITVAARDAERAHALAVRLRTLFSESEISAESDWPPRVEDATLSSTRRRSGTRSLVELSAGAAGRRPRVQAGRIARPRWCAAAREAGCTRVVDGLEVLLGQGAASFERWTGHRGAGRGHARGALALRRCERAARSARPSGARSRTGIASAKPEP